MRREIKKLAHLRRDIVAIDTEINISEVKLQSITSHLEILQRLGRKEQLIAAKEDLDAERERRQELESKRELIQREVDTLYHDIVTHIEPKALFDLEQTLPIALIPVRLETRYVENNNRVELLVRVYPDDLHVETHEAELTEAELVSGQTYWHATLNAENATEDVQSLKVQAWRQLAQSYGAERAAWIAQRTEPKIQGNSPRFPPVALHAEEWTKAPMVSSLPDRWVFIGYQDGKKRFSVWGEPIPHPLPVGMDPRAKVDETEEALGLDAGSRWLIDFKEAERLGMGARYLFKRRELPDLDLLMVFGVKATVEPEEGSNLLKQVLDGHHYSEGLAFLRQGTATNNTEEHRSGYQPNDVTFQKSFSVERGSPLSDQGDESNGDVMARALGVDVQVFEHIEHADLREQLDARWMNAALWHCTWGYFFDQIMQPQFKRVEALAFRQHFVDYVRGRGSLPIMRVGDQPYGVLPVTSLDQLLDTHKNRRLGKTLELLKQLRDEFWMPATFKVPRVGQGDDPDETMLNILGMDSASGDFAARTVYGGHYFAHLWLWHDINDFFSFNSRMQELARKSLDVLGLRRNPRGMRLLHSEFAHELKGALVQEGAVSTDEPLEPNYIRWLIEATPQQINKETTIEPQPNSLLYLLLRHAALMAYGRSAFELDGRFNAHLEMEFVDFERDSPTLTLTSVLDRTVSEISGQASLGHFLHQNRNPDELEGEDFAEFWRALKWLEKLSIDSLEQLLTETLDTCSHRLDAWLSSFANKNLQAIREKQPEGIYLGGFGFVENLKPSFESSSSEYLHAPSLQQAATAAVLRSGHLSHGESEQSPLAVNLSSDRVRLAKWLLDGVRHGQPLGALLGYRFERNMHEARPSHELDKYLQPLRALAPLVAGKLNQSDAPLEAIAANNVVDGLELERLAREELLPWGRKGLPAEGSSDQKAVLDLLAQLEDTIDAVADVVTAEGVFQTVNGNPTHTGAMLDAIANGDSPPPEMDVVKTPRSGIASTHRIVALLQDLPTTATWSTNIERPRALAEPNLNAWLATLLVEPQNVRCNVDFLTLGDETTILASMVIQLSDLQLSPLDALYIISAHDAEGSELQHRIAWQAISQLQDNLPEAYTIRVNFSRNTTWGPEIIDFPALVESLRTLEDLLASSRVLSGNDLSVPGNGNPLNVDVDELLERANTSVGRYRAVHTGLRLSELEMQDVHILRVRLENAADFGLSGAYPMAFEPNMQTLDVLQRQITGTEQQMRDTLLEIDQLHSEMNLASATVDERVEHGIALMQLCFGTEFTVLPLLQASHAEELQQAFDKSSDLQAGDPLYVYEWMSGVARVKPRCQQFQDTFSMSAALRGSDPLQLSVGQLPYREEDRWVAMITDPEDARGSNRLSLVAQTNQAIAFQQPFVGLLFDEWVDVLSSQHETTGLAFNYDQPDSRAPNAVLLAVPADLNKKWDMGSLEDILLESIDLIKLRGVDTEALTDLGQFLPALYFARNVQGRTVSTDFTRNAQPTDK